MIKPLVLLRSRAAAVFLVCTVAAAFVGGSVPVPARADEVPTPAAAPPAGAQSDAVRVDGAVVTPLVLGVDDLKSFPPEQIVSVAVKRQVQGQERVSSVRGVRLTAVLDRAKLATASPHDWKRAVVLAYGTDGYVVVFSWPELFNTEGGAQVVVAFERDGAPLAAREGHIALVPPQDQRPGPRSVHWLTHLEVRVLS